MSDHPLFEDCPYAIDHTAGHVAIIGPSGTGKTRTMVALACDRLRDPLWGLHLICPEGDLSGMVLEHVANPARKLCWRDIHYIKIASPTHACALPLLHVKERTPTACHRKAVRTKDVFETNISFGVEQYGPRLSKSFLLGCFGLALTGRPLVQLPELFAGDGALLRETVSDAYPYHFLSAEMRALDVLSPRAFSEYRDPLISRLMPIFSSPILRRVWGPQPPLDIGQILRERGVVLLDLSGLEHSESILVGTSYASLVFHEALERPIDTGPRAMLMIDEAADYLTADLARSFDRLRKRNIQIAIGLQRLEQMA